MEFRWVALIALWTLLSGPIFSTPSGSSRPRERATVSAAQHTPSQAQQPVRR
jgi:hypothetical protein